MLKVLKIIAISIYAVCGGLLVLSVIPQVGVKALSVATGSMTPAIPQGSLVIIRRVPLSTIKVGEVVTYHDAAKPGQTITHRVVAKTTKNGIPVFTTKGDANKVADPQVAGGSIVGEVVYHLNGAGRVVTWLHSLFGIILIAAIPALIIITGEFQLMIRRLQQYAREEVEQSAVRRSQPLAPRLRRKPRPLIWVVLALVMLPALTLGVQATRAQLSATARLTDTTIATAATTPPSATGSCPSGTTSVSITDTGPGSINKVNSSITCTFTNTTNSSVTISNSSSQTATSGSVTNSGNTSSGGTTSGSASNSSSSSDSVTISK
jgi:signal peptidase